MAKGLKVGVKVRVSHGKFQGKIGTVEGIVEEGKRGYYLINLVAGGNVEKLHARSLVLDGAAAAPAHAPANGGGAGAVPIVPAAPESPSSSEHSSSDSGSSGDENDGEGDGENSNPGEGSAAQG